MEKCENSPIHIYLLKAAEAYAFSFKNLHLSDQEGEIKRYQKKEKKFSEFNLKIESIKECAKHAQNIFIDRLKSKQYYEEKDINDENSYQEQLKFDRNVIYFLLNVIRDGKLPVLNNPFQYNLDQNPLLELSLRHWIPKIIGDLLRKMSTRQGKREDYKFTLKDLESLKQMCTKKDCFLYTTYKRYMILIQDLYENYNTEFNNFVQKGVIEEAKKYTMNWKNE